MKKILYFYPDNPAMINQGNNARANKLLHYFNSRNFKIDFVGETKQKYAKNENFTLEDISSLENKKIIHKGYLVSERKRSGLTYLFKHSIPKIFKKGTKLFDALGVGQQNDFERILKENTYDYILISYVLYSKYITNKKLLKGAKTIVDTHDFFTAQFLSHKKFKLGNSFETEINLLNKFDFIWTISNDEHFIFSQFLPLKNIITIPHGVKNKSNLLTTNYPIDIFYVASNNPHNVNSAQWFFDKVYPLLPKDINITVVGRICDSIPDIENVTKIRFAEDLNIFYEKSKITICPMLSGTGLKIKVVESLSYGKPVVCNERGVDGLLCKINNGCLATNNENDFSNYIQKLISDEDFYFKQATNAKEFFKNTLDEKIIFKKLDHFFNIETIS